MTALHTGNIFCSLQGGRCHAKNGVRLTSNCIWLVSKPSFTLTVFFCNNSTLRILLCYSRLLFFKLHSGITFYFCKRSTKSHPRLTLHHYLRAIVRREGTEKCAFLLLALTLLCLCLDPSNEFSMRSWNARSFLGRWLVPKWYSF